MTSEPVPATEFDGAKIAALRLSLVTNLGPRIFESLIARFRTPENVLAASRQELLKLPGLGQKLAESILRASEIDLQPELDRCTQHHLQLLSPCDDEYPQRLREIPDSPVILYVRGQLLPADGMAISIVGTRHATSYGMQQATRLARGLASAGFTIVSGLARGIDSAAHRGALEARGRTLAVLGSGLLNVYPVEHSELALEIAEHGAVVSEAPTQAGPKSGSFPRRNRIVTGLGLGVVVVEAGDRSGALISARHAMEQGREVFAVPGRIDSRVSRGCHQLIRDGAKLVESIDDVIEELGPLAVPIPLEPDRTLHHPAEINLNEQETRVLNAIETEPTPIDSLVTATGLPIHRVLATISVLEMRHLVRKTSGSLVCRI